MKTRNMLMLVVFSPFMLVSTLWAAGNARPTGYTLLVVPSQIRPVQVGRDLIDRRPVLMVSYEPGGGVESANLHAWSNGTWIRVEGSMYESGSFARTPPTRTIVVGAPEDVTTWLVAQAAAWSPEVLNLESTDTASLVNALGRMFEFSSKEWQWFAARYQLRLEDLNQDRRSHTWYDQPYVDETKAATPDVLTPEPVRSSRPARVIPGSDAKATVSDSEAESFSFVTE